MIKSSSWFTGGLGHKVPISQSRSPFPLAPNSTVLLGRGIAFGAFSTIPQDNAIASGPNWSGGVMFILCSTFLVLYSVHLLWVLNDFFSSTCLFLLSWFMFLFVQLGPVRQTCDILQKSL